MTLDDIARELKTVKGLTANERDQLEDWIIVNMRDDIRHDSEWAMRVRALGHIVAAAKAVARKQRKAG